jgi:hypothetical protein
LAECRLVFGAPPECRLGAALCFFLAINRYSPVQPNQYQTAR